MNNNIPYPKMYALACGGASDALDALAAGETEQAKALLRQALLQAEELYLAAAEATDFPDENFNP